MLHPLWLPEITIRQGHVETGQRTGRGILLGAQCQLAHLASSERVHREASPAIAELATLAFGGLTTQILLACLCPQAGARQGMVGGPARK